MILVSVNMLSAIMTVGLFVSVYSIINFFWWLTTYGNDSFTKHILFCIRNSRKLRKEARERKG